MRIDGLIWPEDRIEHIARHGVSPEMNKPKPPQTDSIQQLAEFWDTHDLTDFEEELEEVPEPVFARGAALKVPLEIGEIEAVERIARAERLSREELVRAWVLQKLACQG